MVVGTDIINSIVWHGAPIERSKCQMADLTYTQACALGERLRERLVAKPSERFKSQRQADALSKLLKRSGVRRLLSRSYKMAGLTPKGQIALIEALERRVTPGDLDKGKISAPDVAGYTEIPQLTALVAQTLLVLTIVGIRTEEDLLSVLDDDYETCARSAIKEFGLREPSKTGWSRTYLHTMEVAFYGVVRMMQISPPSPKVEAWLNDQSREDLNDYCQRVVSMVMESQFRPFDGS
ncbi:hypothetical protein A6E01_19335 (plasmid) [Vibrio breoganii]|uniref:Uncharacterized protein n=1 Tax=Vibrio breoganii TaxID=553239 RepID=A0AAN0XZ95_9VIBR|nr:hypothetical protein [Vibrio breoganii]ANO35369.1 hypothetical protein A6E01_19335 [Vibrio breoganii]